MTITAQNAAGNLVTSYSGTQALTFTGPLNAPNGTPPAYPGSVTFTNGVGTATITLYKSGSTTLTVTQGSLTGTTGSFNVNASKASLGFTSTTVAGVAKTCSPTTPINVGTSNNTSFQTLVQIVPTDSYGNTVTLPGSGIVTVNVTHDATLGTYFNTFQGESQTITLPSTTSPTQTPFKMLRSNGSALTTNGVLTITDPSNTYASTTCLVTGN